jgi:hypothetical protein
MKHRATQMGIDHLTRVLDKNSERGFAAHAHTIRLLSQYNHWPHEALESNPLKLPTLRILKLASIFSGLKFDRLPPLHQDNEIANSIREASTAVDTIRQDKRNTIQGQLGSKEFDKLVRQHCKPIQFSNKLLKHLAPLWELGIHRWNSIIAVPRHTTEDYTLRIQPTDVIMARLPNGDKPGSKLSLRTSIDTLRATLLLPSTTEHIKLPKDASPLITTIHTSWFKHIDTAYLPPHMTTTYATLAQASAINAPSNKLPALHIPDTLPTLDDSNPAPIDRLEINWHKTLLH